MAEAQSKRDIVITWPKDRMLDDYLGVLDRARREGLVINYRVGTPPRWAGAHQDHDAMGFDYGQPRPRCFVVHDGYVRGWTDVLWTCWKEAGEVDGWPEGWYIVRDPEWHTQNPPIPMQGFRGWRWYQAP